MKKYSLKFDNDTADVNVGLIGAGIQQSRSPLMHMREAEAQGFSLDYRLFDLEQLNCDESSLPDLLDDIQGAGFAGVNITHPCKQRVIEYLDGLSDEASNLGAVNTVIFNDKGRIGHNTDWLGFYRSFKKSMPGVAIDKVLQLGSGGAGSAVAYATAKTGVKNIILYDIDRKKSELLATRLADLVPDVTLEVIDNPENAVARVDGIINTTPVGMKRYPGSPLAAALLDTRHWLADIIYFPLETELLNTARRRGCKTMDGSGMAVEQAAEAFRLFTGKQAQIDRMTRTFFKEF